MHPRVGRILSLLCFGASLACNSTIGSVAGTGGGAGGTSGGAGTTGSAGTTGAAGRAAAGTTGTAGRGAAGTTGTAGRGAAGTTGAAGASGAAGTTGATGTAGGGGQPPPVPCGTALADRVTITSIAVTPKIVTKGSGINSVSLPVILATNPNGRAKVAWSDGTNVHVTPLDETGQRAGSDLMVAGTEVRGFVSHDAGSALLVRRADTFVFLRLDDAGAVQAMATIAGGGDHTVSGARWIDDWPHMGRLAWNGTGYAAYFGQTGNFGSQGNHQGDQYRLVSAAGAISGGWDWGCSHSLDERLTWNGTAWANVCGSDTYPGAGIFFANRTMISAEPSITNVGGVAKLGGIVAASDGFYMTLTSPEGRATTDVAFIKISNTGAPGTKVWVTSTDTVQEGFSHLAAYGSGSLLAGWDTCASPGNASCGAATSPVSIAVLDQTGAVTEGPVVTTANIGGQDDFATFANGDAGWAAAFGDLGQLRVVRVAACK